MKKKYRHGVLGYLFILPAVIGFCLFVVYPMVSAAYFSMTDWIGIGKKWNFVGFDNFVYMFTQDPLFYKSLAATFGYVLLTVPTGLALSLGLAVLLDNKMPGMKAFRTVMYIPVVIPGVAALAVWKFAFNPDYGLVNTLLSATGLPLGQWLESETQALPSLAIVALWAGIGSTILIFLGGLQSVSPDLFEAAEIDGASSFRKFWMISIPMITPVILLQTITGTINAFQQFNAPLIMTSVREQYGGPNYSTYLLSLSIYDNALSRQAYSYAMGLVLVLIVIIISLTMVIFRSTKTFIFYESENK